MHPERLSNVFIINPNWFFKVMFTIIRPFLNSRTKKKIKIIEKNEDLYEFFEKDSLLRELGGTSDFLKEDLIQNEEDFEIEDNDLK